MAQHIPAITKAVEKSLCDKYYSELRLHAGRAVDFLGPAMDKYFGENEAAVVDGVQFWLALLNGPLVSLLQDEECVALRVVGCDCLGSIGARVFERLPVSICFKKFKKLIFSFNSVYITLLAIF